MRAGGIGMTVSAAGLLALAVTKMGSAHETEKIVR